MVGVVWGAIGAAGCGVILVVVVVWCWRGGEEEESGEESELDETKLYTHRDSSQNDFLPQLLPSSPSPNVPSPLQLSIAKTTNQIYDFPDSP
jgi:hypothetical protein